MDKIKKIYSDYEIKVWRDEDFDFQDANDFVKLSLKEKKYSFVTDYYRMKILYEEGGIYLDTDMEPKIKLDETELLEKSLLCGYEYRFNVTIGFISMEKGHPFSKELIDYYDSLLNCGFKPSGNLVWTEFLYKIYPELSKSNKTKVERDMKIFNSNAFGLWSENKKNSHFIHRHDIFWINSKFISTTIRTMAKFAKFSPAFLHYIMTKWLNEIRCKIILKVEL